MWSQRNTESKRVRRDLVGVVFFPNSKPSFLTWFIKQLIFSLLTLLSIILLLFFYCLFCLWLFSLEHSRPQLYFLFSLIEVAISIHSLILSKKQLLILIIFSIFFFLFRAAPMTYESFQARNWIRTIVASLCHSRICNLHHSSQQHRILNPMSGARDQTCVFMDTSWVHYQWATMGTPLFLFLLLFSCSSFFTLVFFFGLGVSFFSKNSWIFSLD